MSARKQRKKPPGDVVATDVVYFGILRDGERIPEALWASRPFAKAALAAAADPKGLRIVRTFVTVQIVEGGPSRKPARSVRLS